MRAGRAALPRCPAPGRPRDRVLGASDGAFDISAAVGALYDYRAGIAPSDAAPAARRGGHWHLRPTARRPACALAAKACASTPADSRQGPCSGQRRRSSPPPRHRPRGEIRPAATAASSATAAAALLEHRGSAIRAARARSSPCCRFADVAISTSGDYAERYFIQPPDGVRCHHLIGPAQAVRRAACTAIIPSLPTA